MSRTPGGNLARSSSSAGDRPRCAGTPRPCPRSTARRWGSAQDPLRVERADVARMGADGARRLLVGARLERVVGEDRQQVRVLEQHLLDLVVGARHGLSARADGPVAASTHRSSAFAVCSAVLGLVPDGRVRPVDHLVGDLLPAMGRQAVQHHDVRVRRGPRACWFSWYAGNTSARSSASDSWPMLAHTSVYEHVGALGRQLRVVEQLTLPPVSAAISLARCTTCGIGSNPGGVATRTCIPAFAPARSSECATLLPSPR